MDEAIRLLKKEIERIKSLVVELEKHKLYHRGVCRTCEIVRFQRILDLLEMEYYDNES
jgi:hypothetical protein